MISHCRRHEKYLDDNVEKKMCDELRKVSNGYILSDFPINKNRLEKEEILELMQYIAFKIFALKGIHIKEIS